MKLIAVAASIVLCTTSTFAADLPQSPIEPIASVDPVFPIAPFDWTGFYLGVDAGYGGGREHDNQSQLFPPVVAVGGVDNLDLKGFVAGVHAGYNYQIGQFVLGAEGDVDYVGLDGSGSFVYPGPNPRSLEIKSKWQGSARLRAGYAIDDLLLYVTGGLAVADGELVTLATDASKTHVGWTAGVGAEYAFTQNWVGRLDLRYTDFSTETYEALDGPIKVHWNQTAITAGLSYKF